ncbi:MAG: ABC transporter permease, partial [Christensenellaceae bacterium]|nr:ABC transporter permease [Christensenellaceae bacterium]
MKYLFIKTFRDIKVYWSQFLGVFFMTLISIAIYTGMAVIWRGLDLSIEEYQNESNMANQWIYTKGIFERDMKNFERETGIINATYSATIRGEIKNGDQYLELIALNNDEFMKPYVIKGNKYHHDSNGLWLDAKFAEANKLNPGDKLSIKNGVFEKEFEIKGIVLNIEKIFFTGSNLLTMPDHKTFGYAFISKESLNKLAPFYPYTEIRLGENSHISDAELETILGDKFLFSEKQEDKDFLKETERESSQMKKMSILFSLVFVLLSALTMYSSMSRLIISQRTMIGTMKALGIHTWKIKLHYGLYGLFFSLIGSITGLLLGPIIISPIIVTMKESYIILPYWYLVHHVSEYLIIIGLVFTCIFASLKTTGKILGMVPAVILRNVSNMDTIVKTGFLERIGYIWSKLPLGIKWTLRDNRRNKIRFLMGVIGVVGGMVLMIAGLGVTQSIEHANR